MFKSFALTSSLIIAGSIAFHQAALADSIDVPFSGTVPVEAIFTPPTPGKAEPVIPSNSGGIPNKFESSTPAKIGVQTTTPATITVSPPRLVSGPSQDPSGTKRVAFLEFGSTKVNSNNNGNARLPAGKNDLKVNLSVQRPGAYKPGTYTYVVTLTISP